MDNKGTFIGDLKWGIKEHLKWSQCFKKIYRVKGCRTTEKDTVSVLFANNLKLFLASCNINVSRDETNLNSWNESSLILNHVGTFGCISESESILRRSWVSAPPSSAK